MKITKTRLKQIIKEELARSDEGIEDISDEDVLPAAEPSKWSQEGASPEERLLHILWMKDEIYPKLAAMGNTAEEVAEKLGVSDPEVVEIIDRVMRKKHEKGRLGQQVEDYLTDVPGVDYPYPD